MLLTSTGYSLIRMRRILAQKLPWQESCVYHVDKGRDEACYAIAAFLGNGGKERCRRSTRKPVHPEYHQTRAIF